jgi:hypothetical protein
MAATFVTMLTNLIKNSMKKPRCVTRILGAPSMHGKSFATTRQLVAPAWPGEQPD